MMDETEVDFSQYSKKIDIISKELDRIAKDPKVARRGEELQRKLSTMTPADYLREFTI
jgi:hypothetical protein